MRAVLELLIHTIDKAGGVFADLDGTIAPVGDPEWVDLGIVYIAACSALGHDPKMSDNPFDGG